MTRSICFIDGCESSVQRMGLCKAHQPPCVIEGCDSPSFLKGWCKKHYSRWSRTGRTGPAGPIEPLSGAALVARARDSCVVTAKGCWEYTGALVAGYGQVWFQGGHYYLHRLSLEESIGRRLVGDERACHHCDNPPCFNPEHLYAGTQQTNADDRAARGRVRTGDTRRRLDAGTRATVRDMALRGHGDFRIAQELSISTATARYWRKNFGIAPLPLGRPRKEATR